VRNLKIGERPVSLTTGELRTLCDLAKELRFSHVPNDKLWDAIDPGGTHVVTLWVQHRPDLDSWKDKPHAFDFTHNGGVNVRAVVACQMKRKG
jgi:hypothetical protein